MPHIWADRVLDTTTTTGTGVLTLANSPPQTYQAFGAVCAVSDTMYYGIEHQSANEWEVGLGTYSAANQLTRTTVLASSNSNAAVNFSAGTKTVFGTEPAARGTLIARTFIVDGTWTKPAGLKGIKVIVQAGGGAGGGSGETASGQGSAGAGGAGGGYSIKWIDAADLGATETVTVGAGGVGVSGATGGNGGSSSFGGHCSATGGDGGQVANPGASDSGASGADPGIGSGGDVNGGGSGGAFSRRFPSASFGGTGGGSHLGGGGSGRVSGASNAGPGEPGENYGGGGGGSSGGQSQAAQIGAAGAPGAVIVEEYY